MKIKLVVIGKTDDVYLREGIRIFQQRIVRYLPFDCQVIPDLKKSRNLPETLQKEKEGALLLAQVQAGEELILLDAAGKEYDSAEFARFLEYKMVGGTKTLTFAIGGPYGFSVPVYQAATGLVSLSRMTFSHQLVRLIFCEQLYRALTIIKGEPYHHG